MQPLRASGRAGWALFLGLGAWACGSGGTEEAVPPPDAATPLASASTSAAPPEPPPIDAAKVAAAAGACEPGPLTFFSSPESPSVDRPLAVFALGRGATAPPDGVVLVAPGGAASHAPVEPRHGPPPSLFTRVNQPAQGTYRFVAHRGGEVVGCTSVAVTERPPPNRRARGTVAWPTTRSWTPALEDAYAAWIEKLFDAPTDTQPSFGALHEITRNREANALFDHLGLDEDAEAPRGLRLDPDCADLPYFLRAYFAFKLGLPFAFSSCTRGQAGQAPRCLSRKHSLLALEDPSGDRVRRFDHFLRVTLKDTVHSGSGRTLATDDFTDTYAVRLDEGALRPGTIYADPYGHILVAAKLVPQEGDRAGVLFAVDGQPDGTVARKRFWRGNFLFAQDDVAMGSPGWKRFRPATVERGEVTLLTNAQIAALPGYGDFDLGQTGLAPTAFYDRMDELVSPAPLDPERALLSVIDALEEQVKARVKSVDNGEAHHAKDRERIDMPEGPAIFETTGPWENFSTPARDLRLLVAIDVANDVPARVERRPDRFVLAPGETPAAARARVATRLAAELQKRRFAYGKSDGTPQTLTLAEVVTRAERLEVAYNPNDCPEIRWGAEEGSGEAATCKRRAPGDQRRRMQKVRAWFHERRRPPR